MILRLLRTQNPTVWRGALLGLAIHYCSLAVLLIAFYFIRPFLWSVIFGSPNWHSVGPTDPSSAEGAIIQTVSAFSWLPAGAAALHWGGVRGIRSLLILSGYLVGTFAIGLAGESANMPSFSSAPWYWLSAPVGLLSGAAIYSVKVRAVSRVTLR